MENDKTFRERISELKNNPWHKAVFDFNDGLLELIENDRTGDEIFKYIHNGLSKSIINENKEEKLEKLIELCLQEFFNDPKLNLNIYHLFNLTPRHLNIRFSSFDDNNNYSLALQYGTYDYCNKIICSKGIIDIYNCTHTSFNNDKFYPLKKVSLEMLYKLDIKRQILHQLLMTQAVDIDSASEETIKKASIEKGYPFHLLCGKKTEKQISERTLDEIINSEEFFSGYKLAYAGSERTIGYINRYQTLLYQKDNISAESFLKLINYDNYESKDFKLSISTKLKYFETKFKDNEEIQKVIKELKAYKKEHNKKVYEMMYK